ncbi:hypothetical protein [Aestuariirhabdus sp. LZHN29]|uniref:hypothetical protein n=1 Tax=Aestuariirhabdus sp. LZHN29 TaxID=3417462 RepID=UPI003CF28E17
MSYATLSMVMLVGGMATIFSFCGLLMLRADAIAGWYRALRSTHTRGRSMGIGGVLLALVAGAITISFTAGYLLGSAGG